MIDMGTHTTLLRGAIAIVHDCSITPKFLVIHSQGMCCETSCFAHHVLRSLIAFAMDFSVGDTVFCTRPNGVNTYLCQVYCKRDTVECSTCDLYLCTDCMCEHNCEIDVLV